MRKATDVNQIKSFISEKEKQTDRSRQEHRYDILLFIACKNVPFLVCVAKDVEDCRSVVVK